MEMTAKEIRAARRRVTPRALATFLACPRRAFIEHERRWRLATSGTYPWPPSIREALTWGLAAAARSVAEDQLERAVAAKRAIRLWEEECYRNAPRRLSTADAEAEVASDRDDAIRIAGRALRVLPPLSYATDPRGRRIVDRLVDLPVRRANGLGSGWRVVVPLAGVVGVHGTPWGLLRHFTKAPMRSDVEDDLGLRFDLAGTAAAAEAVLGGPVAGVVVEVVRLRSPSVPAGITCKGCRGGTALGDAGLPCPRCAGTGIERLSTAALDSTVDAWEAALARLPHLDPERERATAANLLDNLRRRGDSFTYRVEVRVRASEIATWHADCLGACRLLAASRRAGPALGWPRNPAACVGPGAHCPFRAVCAGKSNDDAPFATSERDLPGLERFATDLFRADPQRVEGRTKWQIA